MSCGVTWYMISTGSWRTCQTETYRPPPPGRGIGTVPVT